MIVYSSWYHIDLSRKICIVRHSKYFKKTIVYASILSDFLNLGYYLSVFTPYFRVCAIFCYNLYIYTTFVNYHVLGVFMVFLVFRPTV